MSRDPGGSRVTSRPLIITDPASGRSSPVISRNVVVLPAPLGPSRTRNSPSFTASESSRTASTVPNRLLMLRRMTSAMASAPLVCSPYREAATGVEQRQPLGVKFEAYGLADPHGHGGGQPGREPPMRGIDRDNLGRAEILRAEHLAANRRRVGKTNVLRTNPQDNRRTRAILPNLRDVDADAGKTDHPIARSQAGLEAQEVHGRRADEVRHEHARGPVIDLLRRADLLDASLVHDRDLIRHRHRLELIVRHVDRGRTDAIVEIAKLIAHQVTELGIKRPERLIHQKCLRPSYHGAAERDALPVAARKL